MINDPVQPNIHTPTGPPTDQDVRQEARKVAEQFEEIFARQMVQKMRESSFAGEDGGMFGNSPGADTYGDWFDTNMAEHLSSNGSIGIADAVMRHLEDINQIPAEKTSRNSSTERTDLYRPTHKPHGGDLNAVA